MNLWNTPDGRAAVAVGAACWVQLCLAPVASQRGPASALLVAPLALAALLVGALDLLKRPALSLAMGSAGFLGLCGLQSSLLGAAQVPRFDAAARVLAALSSAAFVGLFARAVRALSPAIPGALTPLPEGDGARVQGPALRAAVTLCVAVVAVGCAVLAPAKLGADAMFDGVTSRSAERLLRGRTALTAAGGLALGVLVALSAGSAALRRAAPRARRGTRALTYGVWAGVAWSMRAWLDHAR